MTLLAAVLFTVNSTAIGDQTDVSTETTNQIAKKPTVMILGSTHLANDGLDVYNTKMDDVRAPKRQREIEQLVEQLKEFKPTKIALERDEKTHGAGTQTEYQGYLKGTYKLKRGEGDQIGFRLAKQMGHPKLYCVDYRLDYRKDDPIIPFDEFDWNLLNYIGFAKAHNLNHLLPPPPDEGKVTQGEKGVTWIEPQKYVSIIDMYIRDNEPEGIRMDHQRYIRWIARVGLGDQYPGANWLSHYWYDRNMKIYVNLTRITESAEDRILLIIGGGHVYLIQQFLEESGDYIIESPLKYLGDAAEKLVSEEAD
jgi:hypothetical protein